MYLRTMLIRSAAIGLFAMLVLTAKLSLAEQEWKYANGMDLNDVEVVILDWRDKARDREIPVKFYVPTSGKGPFPVIVFSHGLGGSRDGYEYLGRCWAGHGCVSVHIQHKGSDTSVWKNNPRPMEAMRKAAGNLRNSLDRVEDVRFAIDQLEQLDKKKEPFQGRLDLALIGMAGHSYGAWTTLAVAGEVFIAPGGREVTLGDSRVKAAVAMSAPVPRDKSKLDIAFSGIKIPCLHMTGTLDDSPIGDTTARERRLPFDHSRDADKYLMIFNGGDHMIFSGRKRLPGSRKKDAEFQKLICIASTAFWDAYLKNDARARKFLTNGGLEKALAKQGSLEMAIKKP